MSEYWVSKKRYFCKYCEIYIADDAPSRQHHENGMRHKGNVERFIRGIYKAGEKQKKDLEEEKREMAQVERAANAAFAQDVSAGLVRPGGSTVASSSTTPRKPPPKPSNPFANYSTAASLGYTDPDAERIAAETAIRQSQGVAGEWQLVDAPLPPAQSLTSIAIEHDGIRSENESTPTESLLKREAEAPEDDSRQFKLRKKTLGAGLGEMYDPGIIPIKLKKRESTPPLDTPVITTTTPSIAQPMDLPKFTKIQLKRTGETGELDSLSNVDHKDPVGGSAQAVKSEAAALDPLTSSAQSSGSSKWAKVQWGPTEQPVKTEPLETSACAANPLNNTEDIAPASISASPLSFDPLTVKVENNMPDLPGPAGEPERSLFKKRKTPAGAARGRRQI